MSGWCYTVTLYWISSLVSLIQYRISDLDQYQMLERKTQETSQVICLT